MLHNIQVYYQPFELNAGIFNDCHLIVKPGSEKQVMNITVDGLKELGYEFEDGCNYGEYSQAIFQLLNIGHDKLNIHHNTFKAAGHASMSVGDFIIYRPVNVCDNFVCHVCASAGWKVIPDHHSFVDNHSKVVNAVSDLPIDTIEAMGVSLTKDPTAFKSEFLHFEDRKCENSCPACGKEDIEWGEKDIQDNMIFQNATCNDCGCEFTEEYQYARTVIDDE